MSSMDDILDQHRAGWRIGEYGIPYLEWEWIDHPNKTPKLNKAACAGVHISRGFVGNIYRGNHYTVVANHKNYTCEMPYYSNLTDAIALAEFIYWLPQGAHKPHINLMDYGLPRRLANNKIATLPRQQADLFSPETRLKPK